MGHIYTKSGDTGETGLLGGTRVSKSNARIAAIGELDELNALIGVLRGVHSKVILKEVQDEIFAIGAKLAAGPVQKKLRTPRIAKAQPDILAAATARLEKEIDRMEAALPRLQNFILPGGTPFAAHAHLARAICRRAERALVRLHENEPVNQEILKYINRLSDWFFMAAREENFEKKIPEIPWKMP